jgi:D-apionolactonase
MIENTIDMPLNVPLLPYRLLKAGDITCLYEAGNLRYVKCGDIEMVRMMYGAVRDKNWDTVIPTIAEELITENEEGVFISYTALYNSGDIQYKAWFEISLLINNSILYAMKGTALSSFKKNRIGICVLHPLSSCVGKQVTIKKPAGDSYTAEFPELIAPHQPFKDIQQMQWQPAAQLDACLCFEGDVFETEDQRNWGDSSYKTYSTPLDLPYPVLLKIGETMQQRVVLTITGETKQQKAIKRSHKTILLKQNTFPKIGYSHSAFLNGETFNDSMQTQIHHLRVELYVYKGGWQEELTLATVNAARLNTKLELILFFENDYDRQLSSLVQSIAIVAQTIYSMLLLDKNAKISTALLMSKAYPLIKSAWPSIKVGYGTDAYFASLNRNRPDNLLYDFVSFSVMPQVHASDTRSLIENLECQRDIIKTIRSFTSKEIHISPLSFHKIKNHDAMSEEDAVVAVDTMMDTQFAASWISHAIAQFEEADLISIAFTK